MKNYERFNQQVRLLNAYLAKGIITKKEYETLLSFAVSRLAAGYIDEAFRNAFRRAFEPSNRRRF